MNPALAPVLAAAWIDPAVATILILVGALVMFLTEVVRPDVTAMIIVVALYLTGVLEFHEATAGLGNPVVVTIAAMFAIGHGILKTGAAARLEHAVMAVGGSTESGLIAAGFLAVAVVSAWVQNIAGIVLVLPAIIGVARQRGLSASRLLMPLAAASLTGGMCTLVGSPANLALDAKLRDMAANLAPGETLPLDLQPVGMFETLGIGLAMTAAAIAYYSLVGPHLLPAHRKEESLSETYHVKQFLSEVLLRPGSDLVGKKLVEARLTDNYGVAVLGIVREGQVLEAPDPWTILHHEDVLLVQGASESVMDMRRDHADGMVDTVAIGDRTLRSSDLVLAEVMIAPNSRLVNRSLRELDLPIAFGLNPLAVARHGENLTGELRDINLRIGDVVLVQGHVEGLERMKTNPDWTVLEEDTTHGMDRKQVFIAAGTMVGVILLATFKIVPLAIAAVLGVIALVVGGVMRRREIYDAIEWPVVILIAGMLPLGVALEKTGLASDFAELLAGSIGRLGGLGAIAALYILGTLFTGFLNNAALTLMLAPVALQLADILDVSPRPLLFAVAIGATADFLTPVGQSNALVMGPGRYSFRDYIKVGGPMALIGFILSMFLVPLIWPL